VPEENLLGSEHEGFRLIMANFQWERLVMALNAIGAMAEALERALTYAKERIAFGRPIGTHQAIRHRLADMTALLHSCRSLTYDALRRYVDGDGVTREVTIAKLVTQRAAYELIDNGRRMS